VPREKGERKAFSAAAREGRTVGGGRLHVGTVMLGLGDSIAAGIGASHASQGCMAVLAQRLRALAPRLHLHNLAVPGETSHSLLARGGQMERLEELLDEAAARREDPAPVLISIGGNDVMEAQVLGDEMALTQLRLNLDTVFLRLAEALRPWRLPLGQVACIQTIYNPFEAPNGNGHHSPDTMAPRRATRGGFNTVIREAAASAGVRVAEVARHFRGRAAELTWVGSGDIHPTDAGHLAIAAAYAYACGWRVSLPG